MKSAADQLKAETREVIQILLLLGNLALICKPKKSTERKKELALDALKLPARLNKKTPGLNRVFYFIFFAPSRKITNLPFSILTKVDGSSLVLPET